MTEAKPRLLEMVRNRIRLKHYSIRTEKCCVDWVRRFVHFHRMRHPRDLGGSDVESFLSHLAVVGKVSASTQNQAKSALLFMYKEVLDIDLPWLTDIEAAKVPHRLPVVLTEAEVLAIFQRVDGTVGLMLRLIYGTGMRIMECLRLRVKDIDFGRSEILIREGKGFIDRVTMLPTSLVAPLKSHLVRIQDLHHRDLAEGYGKVYLPYALERKYPNASRLSLSSTDLSQVPLQRKFISALALTILV